MLRQIFSWEVLAVVFGLTTSAAFLLGVAEVDKSTWQFGYVFMFLCFIMADLRRD